MSIAQSEFSGSLALRQSLKRGLARQALADAALEDTDLPGIFRLAGDIGPNRKALERGAQRLRSLRGVVGVALAGEISGLIVTVRSLRQVITRTAATELFAETALLYTRIVICSDPRSPGFKIQRASFSAHSLERLVERSLVPLDRHLLPAVDAEALVLLRRMASGSLVEADGDVYAAASLPGAWAGSLDLTTLEPDWGLAYIDAETRIAVFSVRTYLGPTELRPTVRTQLTAS